MRREVESRRLRLLNNNLIKGVRQRRRRLLLRESVIDTGVRGTTPLPCAGPIRTAPLATRSGGLVLLDPQSQFCSAGGRNSSSSTGVVPMEPRPVFLATLLCFFASAVHASWEEWWTYDGISAHIPCVRLASEEATETFLLRKRDFFALWHPAALVYRNTQEFEATQQTVQSGLKDSEEGKRELYHL
ncbi:Hypothetical predicted protein [Cloeon dipterum]|uniref:Uncharacterized protein n=1 Tax=Cloeon dipterum TaxID=197152 RepID=A0A8S1D2U9_9INSE|nr:Hypothetical predicted protein [Cloeon dipterum]